MAKDKRITSLAELGKLAGVTAATASRALADSPEISKQTKERIKALAQKHSYTINASARSLRMQKTNAIAVLLNSPDKLSGTVSAQPFVADVIARISDALADRGWDMNLSSERSLKGCWDQYYLKAKRADGLIVLGQADNAGRLNELADLGTPFVVFGAYTQQRKYCVVGCSSKRGGLLATNHLVKDAKRSRILFIGPISHFETAQRLEGYKKALKDSSIEYDKKRVLSCDYSVELGAARMRSYLDEQGCDFDGVFACSDELGYGVIHALKEAGISVPNEVSVMGFDDIRSSRYVNPPLSTISQNLGKMVDILVDSMIDRIEGRAVKSVEIPVELIVRSSTLPS